MRSKSVKIVIKFSLALAALLASIPIFSQSIERPLFEGAGSNSGITRCISGDEILPITVEAQITGGLFPEGTTFTLQLSNKQGTFGSSTFDIETKTTSGSSVIFEDFILPSVDGSGEILGSETYTLRVIANTDPIVRGRVSPNLSAYFFNGEQPELIPQNQLCIASGATGVLTAVDEFDEYIWVKDRRGDDFTPIPGETGRTLNVTEPGRYEYAPNLGSCNQFLTGAFSNQVRVSIQTPIPVSINNLSTTTICASGSVVLESSQTNPDFNYQWTRDGEAISGEINTSITVTGIEAEGEYKIEVIDPSLPLNERCASQSNPINVDLLNPSIKITSPLNVVDVPGQDEILVVEVDGVSPVITWIKDGVEIPDSNTTSFVATGLGVYTAKVVDNASTCEIKEGTTEDAINVTNITNLTFSIQAPENISDCELRAADLTIGGVRIFNDSGDALTPESLDGLEFAWLKNGTLIDGETESTLELEELADNGNYTAEVSIGGTVFDSENNVDVVLNLESLSISQEPEELEVGGSVELTLELPSDIAISDFVIQWIRGNNFEIPGETGRSLTVTNPGTYTARVSLSGCGTSTVEQISIQSGSAVIPNVLSRDIDALNNDWILPGELRGNSEIKVEIYSNSGQLDYTSEGEIDGYIDQWPEESKSQLKESIYYYVISRNNNPVEKGSITIIR
ncbi:gliding motility-associated C-terminal domain-containing protein [Aquimarina agarivorans]|uniref:T9SS type B sorting domain-containing protein n=1 Tax=Aquimarina agarivorans TaxID=980584 RepID=UPI000248EFC3|nr:gliding motility-associated C-terminal domain-containing protein [Aquimarina agarivorans]